MKLPQAILRLGVLFGSFGAACKLANSSPENARVKALILRGIQQYDLLPRKRSIDLLTKVCGLTAAAYLVESLAHNDIIIRAEAAETLEGLGWAEGNPGRRAMLWGAQGKWDEFATLGDYGAELLLDHFSTEQSHQRCQIARVLGELRSSSAIPHMLESLKTSNRSLQRTALVALGKIGDSSTLHDVFSFLGDSDAGVRSAARQTFSRFLNREEFALGGNLVDSLEGVNLYLVSSAASLLAKMTIHFDTKPSGLRVEKLSRILAALETTLAETPPKVQVTKTYSVPGYHPGQIEDFPPYEEEEVEEEENNPIVAVLVAAIRDLKAIEQHLKREGNG